MQFKVLYKRLRKRRMLKMDLETNAHQNNQKSIIKDNTSNKNNNQNKIMKYYTK